MSSTFTQTLYIVSNTINIKNEHFFLFLQCLRDARNCLCTQFPTHAQWARDIQLIAECAIQLNSSYLHHFCTDPHRVMCVTIASTSSAIRTITSLQDSWPSFHCRVFQHLSMKDPIYCRFWGVRDHHPYIITSCKETLTDIGCG